MVKAAYSLQVPSTRSTSVIFASPHSGRDYGADFLASSVLDAQRVRSSEDAFVDQLFAAAPDLGAPLLAANAPRAYVDLNRGVDELDPALIRGVTRTGHNPRISSGLGVVPRVVSNGQAIYRGKMAYQTAQQRLADVWHPYHAMLQSLLDESRAQFGAAVLIDCHSMPHEAVQGLARGGKKAPQIVLGDRYGASADSALMAGVEAAFVAAGLRVARNAPFAGAYITQHYGRPSRGQHVIQIEIDRALYMDEASIIPHAGFDAFRAQITQVVADIAALGRPIAQPLAAE